MMLLSVKKRGEGRGGAGASGYSAESGIECHVSCIDCIAECFGHPYWIPGYGNSSVDEHCVSPEFHCLSGV